jgi:MFS transporter, DHA2 family, multidrug resistance protein
MNAPRWILILTVMTVAILEVLDSTIVNVSLPAMMPALGANQEQITWILTSYVVASAIMVPLTGFLAARLGQKKLLLLSISGFMISSFFCGIADTLGIMVFFRLCQGAFGASLIPLSQSIMRQNYPLEEQGKAMAIWGIGIMSAPVLGPVLGGFITENWSWRWVFYINIPVCFSALTLTWLFVQNSPTTKAALDKIGLILMIIGIGSLQLFLDQGNSKDWFSSPFILILALISSTFIVLFLIRCLLQEKPIIRLSIYKDRNFTLCSILFASYCGVLFSILMFEPIILESIFNYPIITAGVTTASCGIASAVGMGISAPLIKVVKVKYILFVALILSALGAWKLSVLNLNAAQWDFVKGNAILGFGLGLFMVPMALYSLATLPPKDITEGAGLFTYSRMLGTSIGIAIFTTLFMRQIQKGWYHLLVNIHPTSPKLAHFLSQSHMHLQNPQTPETVSGLIQQHATMLSFNFTAQTIALLFILMIPLVLLLKTVQIKTDFGSAH